MKRRTRRVLLTLALGVLACDLAVVWFFAARLAVPRYHGKPSPHFDGGRFKNLEPFELPGLGALLRWKFMTQHERWPERVEFPEPPIPPTSVTDGARITFINHATVLIQLEGLNVLTDPVFSERIGPFPRFGPKRHKSPGLAMERLPRIDVILLSHNHYDHLDVPSLKRLVIRDRPKILAGLGNTAFLQKNGLGGSIDLDLWEHFQLDDVTFTLTPAQHWSARSLTDRRRALWGAFYVQSRKTRIYFAGDTGYGSHFSATAEKLGAPDVALLPIGAYEPRWIMRAQHMDPEEAVLAHLALQAKVSIAIHFGCFALASEGMLAPQTSLKHALSEHRLPPEHFLMLEHGQSYVTLND